MERWGPALLTAATSQFTNLVQAVELCLEHDVVPERAFRLLVPMFAAVHEGHPSEVWAIGQRALERWPEEETPSGTWPSPCWPPRRPSPVGTATCRRWRGWWSTMGPPARSRWRWPNGRGDCAAREHDPRTRRDTSSRAAAAAATSGFTALRREVQVLEASQIDLAGGRDRALELLADSLRDGRAAGDLLMTTLAHLVEACVLMRAGRLDAAEIAVASAEHDGAEMRQPWWTAATLRTRAALTSLRPGGWPTAAPRWREAGRTTRRSLGALGEIAIVLRTAASVAEHVGERGSPRRCSAPRRPHRRSPCCPSCSRRAGRVAARARPGAGTAHLVEALARRAAALDAVVVPSTRAVVGRASASDVGSSRAGGRG